jgi:hypothetical protein
MHAQPITLSCKRAWSHRSMLTWRPCAFVLQIFNAIKYSTAFPVIIFSAMKYRARPLCSPRT